MTAKSMATIKSSLLDALSVLTVIAAFWREIKLSLVMLGVPVEWIPAVGAVAAAIVGAAVGRVLDWSKEAFLKYRSRSQPKRPAKKKAE